MAEETSPIEKITPRSVGIKFGLYNAVAGLALFVIALILNDNPFSNTWNWIGFGIGVALVVLGHKDYKDNGDGYMAYGQGVGISFWIGLIATVISAPLFYIYLTYIDSSPFDLFLREQEDKLIENGMSDEAITVSILWTKNLFWPMTFIIGIIGSVVIGLVVSIFTQKKRPESPI